MLRARVFALCLVVLLVGASAPRAHALDDATETVLIGGAIGAAAGGVFGLLIMMVGRQGQMEERLKRLRPEPKERATLTPLQLKVHF